MLRDLLKYEVLFAAVLSVACARAQAPAPLTPNQPPPAGLTAPAPPAGPATTAGQQQPYSTTGTVRGWNYGPAGEINGFLLSGNVLVNVPPEYGSQMQALTKSNSRVKVSGYGRSGVNVQTVVDAQTVEANGQTIDLPAPPPPTGPGPRGRRAPPPAPANAPPPPAPNGPPAPPPALP